MPQKSLKRTLLHLLSLDCQIGIKFAKNSKEIDAEIDDFLFNIESLLCRRYIVRRSVVPKSDYWITQVLPNLDDKRFKSQLRVTRSQFHLLMQLIADDPIFEKKRSSKTKMTNTHYQLALVLYRFGHHGTGSSYSNVAAKFCVGEGNTSSPNQIFWPNIAERVKLADTMGKSLPGCIGYIDGTHINLEEKPSLPNAEDYYSRKQRYGLHLQIVCDNDLYIRHYKVGRTACAHDAKVFSECVLANNPNHYFSRGEFLAGDSAYALKEYLITPYRKNATYGTKAARNKFNKIVSHHRVKVEHAIGVLKEKFSSLKQLRIKINGQSAHIFACQWIEACVILHNICLLRNDNIDFDVFYAEDDDYYDTINWGVDEVAGEFKRKALCDFVNNFI